MNKLIWFNWYNKLKTSNWLISEEVINLIDYISVSDNFDYKQVVPNKYIWKTPLQIPRKSAGNEEELMRAEYLVTLLLKQKCI